jgi:hypothetical protein
MLVSESNRYVNSQQMYAGIVKVMSLLIGLVCSPQRVQLSGHTLYRLSDALFIVSAGGDRCHVSVLAVV